MNKTSLCPYPWSHLYLEPSGDVRLCCMSSSNLVLGNVKHSNIEDIWNSNQMKEIRLKMLNREWPAACMACKHQEIGGGKSQRIHAKNTLDKKVEALMQTTLKDGTLKDLNLIHWDFRFSNVCNFKCRTCWRGLSSSWLKEDLERGVISEIEPNKYKVSSINNEPNIEFLSKHIDSVETIYFAGGEPLLSSEHWSILDLLIEKKKFNVRLHYSSNLSSLTFGKKNILDYWSLWPPQTIKVNASIDEVGERAELIRKGTIWEEVVLNLKLIKKIKSVYLKPTITVSCFNVSRLDVIVDFLLMNNILDRKIGLDFNIVRTPKYYNISIYEEDYKQFLILKYKEYIKVLKDSLNSNTFNEVLFELTKSQNRDDLKELLKNILEIDNFRKENSLELIPELKNLLRNISQEV